MARHYRRTRNHSSDGLAIAFLALIAIFGIQPYRKTIAHYAQYLTMIATLTFMAIALAWMARTLKNLGHQRRLNTLGQVDAMSGLEFEYYVANLLRHHNFKKVSLTEKYDMGVDIIAEKEGVRWGIQAKRYSNLVKGSAVSQVVAGLNSYNCDKAMVITNSSFSKYAIKLAQSNHCILIDRTELAKLISEV